MAGRSSIVRTALTAALAALALVPAASAGRVHGDTSSLSLVVVVDVNANGLPNWGDTVTFSVSTTATTQPSVNADCSQNGALVYRHYGFFYGAPSPSQDFVLHSYLWTGGAADCTATLYYIDPKKGREVDLATLPFHVDG